MNVQMPQAMPSDAAAATPPQSGGAQRPVATAAAVLPGIAQPAAAPPQSRQPNKAQLEQAVENLKRANHSTGQNLQFSVDLDSGDTVIKVVDSVTKEVIRQIPSEEVLELARELDRMQGLLLRQQA